MAVGDRKDPYGSYNFLVEVDGITRAGFQECSGLDSTQDAGEYREGTDPLTMRKLPGLVTYSNLSLKWGITDDAELWEWRQTVMDGKVQRKNISVVPTPISSRRTRSWIRSSSWPMCTGTVTSSRTISGMPTRIGR